MAYFSFALSHFVFKITVNDFTRKMIFKTLLIKTICLFFHSFLLRQWLTMGVEETYWGIPDELFLQVYPHLLKPVNFKKGGNFEVKVRQKEEGL